MLERFARAITRVSTDRPWTVIAVFAALLVLGSVGASHLEMRLNYLELLPENDEAVKDLRFVMKKAGSEGYLGILPRHAPLLTALGPGEFRVKKGGVEEVLAVFGGFMDVRPDRVVVLTDAAEPAGQIDLQRAQRARERAQEGLAQAGALSAADEARARAELQRALVRLRVSERRRRPRS